MSEAFKLYSYFRSSASYRVRIVLHYKNVPFEYIPVHLLRNGGEQHQPDYQKINPLSQVPTLVHNDRPLTQSMAIMQYLDDLFADPPLLPSNTFDRSLVLQICEIINSGIQPLQNTAVTGYLEREFGLSSEQKAQWLKHWIGRGMHSLEETLKKTAGDFCFGDTVTLADCCLVPQVVSSKRFGVDPSGFKTIMAIYENAMEVEAFQLAEPAQQPDAEKS